MKKLFISTLLCLFFLLPLATQTDEEASTGENKKRVAYTTNISVVVTWPPKAMVDITQGFKVPLMTFNHPLMRGNNINFKIGTEITPVTIDGKFNITWTPLAFLELFAESKIASGWKLSDKLMGIALNENQGGKSHYTPLNFSKAVYSFSLGGTFQFDLGAVIPHDWSHVVFKTDHYALYRAMTGVNSETSWVYRADEGTNRNGWRYMSSYVVGYQMPIFLNLIAMKIDVEKKLFASPAGLDSTKWGENLFITTFGPVINFNIKKDYNILLLAQWTTGPVYTSTDPEIFYQNNVLDSNKKTQVKFYHVGIMFHMNINR